MIYCVVPRELADELYDQLVDYYADNPNVTVIVDRRSGADRRARQGAGGERDRAAQDSATGAARASRARSRTPTPPDE